MGRLSAVTPQTSDEDRWQRYATAKAIEALRKIAVSGNTMPKETPVGRLSETEWGWLFSAALFAWLAARAEQATAEGRNVEATIKDGVAEAWDAGAIGTILPDLANIAIDWSLPLSAWPKETMIGFLGKAFDLMRVTMVARDLGGGVTRQSGIARIAREVNGAAGGPFAVGSEMDDEIPF